MKLKTYLYTTKVIFDLIALLHLARLMGICHRRLGSAHVGVLGCVDCFWLASMAGVAPCEEGIKNAAQGET